DAYLPGIHLPSDWIHEPDATRAVAGAELILMVVPSKAFREVARCLAKTSVPVVTATKGIELESGLTMGGILTAIRPDGAVAALSGPSLAPEVARDVPTAVVA